jgi:RHS repeat-associated protein
MAVRRAAGRAGRRARRVAAAGLAPVLAAGTSLFPVMTVAVAGAAAVTAVSAVVAAAPARASLSGSVLILQTSVNGGSSSAEAQQAAALGLTVTVASASTWDAMTKAQFGAYTAIVIGDPSASSCSSAGPSDALSTAGTWGPAVTGNVAVLGTAPALAGATTLIRDAIAYAASGASGTTGLYVSLNCEYSSASAGTSVPLLASVDGGGYTVTGQSSSCPDAGTVNTWEALALAQFNGLTSANLGPWSSPACSVQETFNAWPAALAGLGYDAGVTPATFTASDGATGQAYLLAGAVPSPGTLALAPSTGGQVPAGAVFGGANMAAPGVSHATAGDPVDTQSGDFHQSSTDLSVPTFGPGLDFSRTYDAQLARAQTVAGTPVAAGSPGSLGYGWTNNWDSSLSAGRPVPGDIYTMAGLRTNNGNGGAPTSQPMLPEGGVISHGGNTFIADSSGDRVLEVAGAAGTQWGIPMTAGDMYVIAGSPVGAVGGSPNGTAAAAALLNGPQGLAVDPSGNLYIADTGNNRVLEIPAVAGQNRGFGAMTVNDVYTIAGNAGGSSGHAGDGGAAASGFLSSPVGVSTGHVNSDIYIADSGNSRVQEIPAAGGTQWGQPMTAFDMYTVAGNAGGTAGISGDGGAATSGFLSGPDAVTVSGGPGDLYIADTGNNRIQEVPAASGAQWGITPAFTRYDMYTVAGSAVGASGHSANGTKATSALLNQPTGVFADNGTQLYVTSNGDNRVQEVARASHAEWGISMTLNDIYTIAGTGNGHFSGDGGAATAAELHAPMSVALDGSFNLFIADGFNRRVREVSASTAVISTFAGNGFPLWTTGNGGPATAAGLHTPSGAASDARGDIFIADAENNRVQEIAASAHTQFGIAMTAGDVYTVAGSDHGANGVSGDGGPATSAFLGNPEAVAVDGAGNLFIADTENNRIQEVSASTAVISTVAGSAAGTAGSSGDTGPAGSALLNNPVGVTVDGSGNVFIADFVNNRVQEVPAASGGGMTAGDMYTIAGSAAGTAGHSGDGGPAASALLLDPSDVTADAAGDVYIADSGNNRVQEIYVSGGARWGQSMTAGDIYTIAGQVGGTAGTSGNGGPAASASLNAPTAVAVDSSGNLYLADSGNNRIQEIAAASGTQWSQQMTAGDVYTVAGQASGIGGQGGDGGPATAAHLYTSDFVAVDPAGNLYITDFHANLVREVVATAASPFGISPPASGVTISQGNGSQVTFYPAGSGCTAPYVAAGNGGFCALPQDVAATLSYSAANGGTYTYSPSPGLSYTYAAAGSLTAETDAAGNTLTIGYGTPAPGSGNCPSTANWCQTITSASGRALTIGYNASSLVTSVTDPMGRRWTYGYTGQDLTSATDPMTNVTSYTYGQGSTGNPQLASDLLTITSPNAQPGGPDAGDSTVNVYDSSGRVTSQTDPMGSVTTFSYCVNAQAGDCMNASTGTGDVTVTDAQGNASVDNYAQGVLTAATTWNGSTPSEHDFGPAMTGSGNAAGTLLTTWFVNAVGGKFSYTYDQVGHLTADTSPLGNTTTRTSTSLGAGSCAADAIAASPCSPSQAGPSPVAPGGVITPPSSAPPPGVSYGLNDTNGHALYETTGVYPPGSNTASAVQTSYVLYKGNSVTLNGTNITCAVTPPSPSLPCAQIDPSGQVMQLAYDSAGDLVSESTPDGNGSELATITNAYDGDGEQTSTTSPDGNLPGANPGNYTTITAYNADDQQTSVTQADGSGATVTPRTTSYGHDANGNQTTVTDPRGNTTTTTYDADGESVMVTDPIGSASLTCYDRNGNVAQTVPPAGVAAGSLTPASCPTSYPSGYGQRLAADAFTYAYDATGRDTTVTSPAPAGQTGHETTTTTYNAEGLPVQVTGPPASNGGQDQVTVKGYNADEQLISQTTGYGTSAASTVSYCYDPAGEQTAVVAADANTGGIAPCETSSPWVVSSSSYPAQAAFQTTYSYDSAGQLVSTMTPATAAAPSGATTTFTYDTSGDLLTSTDPNGVITTTTYTTPGGPVATVSYSGSAAHSVSYTNDAQGTVTGMTDGTGTSAYIHDPFGELTSATNGAGQTTGYTYNADGETTGITYPLPASATWASTDTVGYGYDHVGQLTSVTDFTGHQITITPDADGRPSAETLGSTGDTISYTYDPASAPSAIALKNSTSTLQSFSYSDAPDGGVLSETGIPASSTSPASYTYDAQGRVTSMTPGSGSAVNYGFDASGNLTTLPTGATGTYDNAGELTSGTLSGTTTTYPYNADGQQLAARQGPATIASGTWDGAGRLTSYNGPAADMTAATYDGAGLRASETTGSGTQNFVWGQDSGPLMDSANAYIYAGGTAPAEQVSLSAGTVSYLTADSLGSVRGIVSSAGSLTATTSYDAWGSPLTTGGLTSSTPFGYAGGYTDPTGLIYLINRYYDPATGQFLSLDPAVSQTGQPYGYAGGNPVNAADPDGLGGWQAGIFGNEAIGSGTPGSGENVFQTWVGALLGVPNKDSYGWQLSVNMHGFHRRFVDIYQPDFRWLNELKVGIAKYGNDHVPSTNGYQVRQDRYMIAHHPGVMTFYHPGAGEHFFHVNGGTDWFRYKETLTTACQMPFISGASFCPNDKFRDELVDGHPFMNIVYVNYIDRHDPQSGASIRAYRDHKAQIRAALEDGSTPFAALRAIGLPVKNVANISP